MKTYGFRLIALFLSVSMFLACGLTASPQTEDIAVTDDSNPTADGRIPADAEVIAEIATECTTNLADQSKLAVVWEFADGYYFGKLGGKGGLTSAFGDKTDGFPIDGGFKENTQYTIAYTGKTKKGTTTEGTGFRAKVFYTDGTTELLQGIPHKAYDDVRIVSTTDANKSVEKITLTYGTNNEQPFFVKDLSIEEGKTSGYYVPYNRTFIDYTARQELAEMSGYGSMVGKLRNECLFRLESDPLPIPVGDEALGYNAFIEQTWDTLLSDYPDLITKSVIIESTTTETVTERFNIYQYVITPERGYDATVLLTAGVHGIEYESYWGLYRFIRLMMDEGYRYEGIRTLRHRIRFIIIPSWNPWGVEHGERVCPLGIRADRNLNDSVENKGVEYPAFASNEAKSIKMVMDEYDDIALWADLHTDPYAGSDALKGCYGYAPYPSVINTVLYDLTVDFQSIIKNEWNYKTDLTIYNSPAVGYSHLPSYGTGRGIPSCVLEVSTHLPDFPLESGSAGMMKLAEEWYGNVITNMILALY